jgi:hypothetical protein
MDKSLIIVLFLFPVVAFGQTHTMPGSNVVPSGASLTINSGGSITAAAGSTVTGFAPAGDHAVYAGASPPTTDVGTFVISKTGVDLKTAGTTTVFTVPTGRAFVCTSAIALVTAVTGGGAGTETFQIKESGAGGAMTQAGASGSSTPVVGTYYETLSPSSAGPYARCAASNAVQVVVATSQALSTTVTGTVFVTGFYTQ